MKFININPGWGTIVYANIDEVLSIESNFWTKLGYERDLILFKGLGNISNNEYYDLVSKFGNPWAPAEYVHSNEIPFYFDTNDKTKCITKFSNKLSKLGNVEMPWHVDIPHWGEKSYPWRSLYNIKNPNPFDGLTSWVNLRLDLINPTNQELLLYNNITVTLQSWHQNGIDEPDITLPYIKEHVVTNVKSLRSNYFVSKKSSKHAWIKQTFINDIPVDNYKVLGNIHKIISNKKELVYTHQWEETDLIIYDNWNLMHKRTGLNLNSDEERLFHRVNIHHK